LTSQTATQSGGPANGLMNLTYGYQASAGQMGAGTTAGNAGQLISISGTIGGVTESAAYTYDDLGRLVTSNQTSNTSSAQRRFAYDRWGNRTGMWDAVSGGNQIQSITLQQSGGAPTNRITSVTTNPGGSTVNYSYDAAGNVTNDGVHSYGYDSENRIVSVDGGSTGSYAYDNQNRRYKKTIGSTVTHYVWEGSHVLAEHNGSNGGVLIDYVYSGTRMIAKVASGSTQYYLSDRLSLRLSLDTSGNITGRQGHLPFGEDFGETGTQQKQHFTSYERDSENGTNYAMNRQYFEGIGRFNRGDPLASSARKETPQSFNRYAYANNEPIDHHDPMGLILCGGLDPLAPCTKPPAVFDPLELDPCTPHGASYLLDGFEMANTDLTCTPVPTPAPLPSPLGDYGSPCGSVWANTLRFDKERTYRDGSKTAREHIYRNHISETEFPFPEKSKFYFTDPRWNRTEQIAWVEQLARSIFEKGKGKAFFQDGAWFIVYGVEAIPGRDTIYDGVGLDASMLGRQLTNVVTLVLDSDCQSVSTFFPGLPARMGVDDERIGGAAPHWRSVP